MSTDLGYSRAEDGRFQCANCLFATPHEHRIQRHQVKSHQHEPYPAPPLLAEKWRDLAEPPSAAGAVLPASDELPNAVGAAGKNVRVQTSKTAEKDAKKGQEVKDG